MQPATPETSRPRTVIFVRHAQSEWNRATKRPWIGLPAALFGRDHALTPKGYAQADALREELEERKSHERVGLASVHSATAVWSSPCTRALQTAFVALLPLFQRDHPPVDVAVRPVAREQKNTVLSRDNVGAAKGDGVVERACNRLGRLPAPPGAAALETMRSASLRGDLSEVHGRWWTHGAESAQGVQQRTTQLLHELQQSSHETLIVVSHSNFIRRLLDVHLSRTRGCKRDDSGEMATALRTRKVPNCGVVVCTLDPDGETPLRDCELCWPPDAKDRMMSRSARRRGLWSSTNNLAKVAPSA